MRSFLIAFTALSLVAGGAAQAKVAITVDKDNQQMTVAVDGVERYHWPVSSGIPSYETPSGSFRTFRMEEDHYSKEFDDAPMPHSIFFTKIGHAIHGTDSESKLGSPASHGCVRLSKANAATLYALVEKDGVLNTTVTLTGSSQIALARNPRPRSNGISSARKYSGPSASIGIRGFSLAWEDDRPSTSHGALNTPGPKNGGASTGVILVTPGSAWSAGGIRSNRAVNLAWASARVTGIASHSNERRSAR